MEKTFDIGVSDGDFEECLGRPPKDKSEFEDFAHMCEKGVKAQIDWDIIYQVTKENWKYGK